MSSKDSGQPSRTDHPGEPERTRENQREPQGHEKRPHYRATRRGVGSCRVPVDNPPPRPSCLRLQGWLRTESTPDSPCKASKNDHALPMRPSAGASPSTPALSPCRGSPCPRSARRPRCPASKRRSDGLFELGADAGAALTGDAGFRALHSSWRIGAEHDRRSRRDQTDSARHPPPVVRFGHRPTDVTRTPAWLLGDRSACNRREHPERFRNSGPRDLDRALPWKENRHAISSESSRASSTRKPNTGRFHNFAARTRGPFFVSHTPLSLEPAGTNATYHL